ncbi:MAG: double zinc ribbon domain-containing protein [Deltaproteobacteria bacterium]|nr:double zinc ribbon domain-containing protein [Deltaproteobacteria bacterium]
MTALQWLKLQSRELLWPSRCAACDAFVAPDVAFCAACEPSITALGQACTLCAMPRSALGEGEGEGPCQRCQRQPWRFASVRAAVLYGGAISTALVRFKHGRQDLVHALAPLVWAGLAATPDLAEALIVPVPLHPRRLRQRGFNQAFDLARAATEQAAAGLRLALAPLCMRRLTDGLHVAQETAAARRARAQGAFAVAQPRRVAGRPVILVDDVLTTGATSGACAEALLAAGATSVSLVVAARTV